MPVVAIVGAGPGMGLAIARTFGAKGFDVALISRTRGNVDALATRLGAEGITAAGFTADVLDRPSLTAALRATAARFGPVDVLEYSPAPHSPVPGITLVPPSRVTVENFQPQIDYNFYGAIAATAAVLPAMREAGTGTLLFTTGGGSVKEPRPASRRRRPNRSLRSTGTCTPTATGRKPTSPADRADRPHPA